jgi:hypothetical protein
MVTEPYGYRLVTDGGTEPEPIEKGDRARGILTPTDRAYVRATDSQREAEYSRPAREQRWRYIRDRAENAVYDIGILSKHSGNRLYTYLFADEIPDGRKASADTERTRRVLPEIAVFFIRAVLAGEPDRPLNSPNDLAAVLRPVLDELERGVDRWSNRQHGLRADVETEVTVEKLQTIEGFIDELQIQRTVPPDEYFEAAATLSRAGYDDDEITTILGPEPDPDGDDNGRSSEYAMQQLVEFPVETLTELIATGKITQDEHTEAIRRKAETGDIDRG